jgi:hypothetical protein
MAVDKFSGDFSGGLVALGISLNAAIDRFETVCSRHSKGTVRQRLQNHIGYISFDAPFEPPSTSDFTHVSLEDGTILSTCMHCMKSMASTTPETLKVVEDDHQCAVRATGSK